MSMIPATNGLLMSAGSSPKRRKMSGSAPPTMVLQVTTKSSVMGMKSS